uniref:Lipase domain-containing protein n=1 Tax=Romanomermis culicivorax TaxID=13658 RepID=A0A915JD63_ROMCU
MLVNNRFICNGGFLPYHVWSIDPESYNNKSTLDPAGPFFDCYPNLGLTKNSAPFVQVLHTDAEGLLFHFGTERQMGHIDYYVNPGQSQQPGCLIP